MAHTQQVNGWTALGKNCYALAQRMSTCCNCAVSMKAYLMGPQSICSVSQMIVPGMHLLNCCANMPMLVQPSCQSKCLLPVVLMMSMKCDCNLTQSLLHCPRTGMDLRKRNSYVLRLRNCCNLVVSVPVRAPMRVQSCSFVSRMAHCDSV